MYTGIKCSDFFLSIYPSLPKATSRARENVLTSIFRKIDLGKCRIQIQFVINSRLNKLFFRADILFSINRAQFNSLVRNTFNLFFARHRRVCTSSRFVLLSRRCRIIAFRYYYLAINLATVPQQYDLSRRGVFNLACLNRREILGNHARS